jgi:hypothetical protein
MERRDAWSGREDLPAQPLPTPAAKFLFYGDLNDLLPHHRRQQPFSHPTQEHSTVKGTIEAIGVPHPGIPLILINGRSVGFDHHVPAGDQRLATEGASTPQEFIASPLHSFVGPSASPGIQHVPYSLEGTCEQAKCEQTNE